MPFLTKEEFTQIYKDWADTNDLSYAVINTHMEPRWKQYIHNATHVQTGDVSKCPPTLHDAILAAERQKKLNLIEHAINL